MIFALAAVSGRAQEAPNPVQVPEQAPAPAQKPAPFPDFSAKFVKPPKKGAQKRITVQVPPRAEPAIPPRPSAAKAVTGGSPAAIPVTSGGHAAPQGAFSWFWQHISPKAEDSGPGRLEQAVLALSKAPAGQEVVVPRLQELQQIAAAHGSTLLRTTVGTQVSPALALAVISVESAGHADAISSAGAKGLMQLMPETAKQYGGSDLANPEQNITGGVAFLNTLMGKFDRDPVLVLAAYNAGETAIAEHGGVPPFAQTRDYVPKVLAAFQVARGLCLTPPELISDGCVFRVMVQE
jgi:soluble lytic murein transglycosylase-like protein